MQEEIILDEDIAEKRVYMVKPAYFYLLILVVLVNLGAQVYEAFPTLNNSNSIDSVFRVYDWKFRAFETLCLLFVIRFRFMVYRASELNILKVSAGVILSLTVVLYLSEVIINNVNLELSSLRRVFNLLALAMWAFELIKILSVPKNSIVKPFKYFKYFALGTFIVFACYLIFILVFRSNPMDNGSTINFNLINQVLEIGLVLPMLFLIPAAAPYQHDSEENALD